MKLFVLAGVEESDEAVCQVAEEGADGPEDEPQRPQGKEEILQEAGWAPFIVIVVVVHGSEVGAK